MKRLFIFTAILLLASSPSWAAQKTVTVGTSGSKAALDVNFGNTQDNFTEIYGWLDQGVKTTSDVSFASVTATGFGGLASGVQSSQDGSLILYSNDSPHVFGLSAATTFTETVNLKVPSAMPTADNSMLNFDINGTGGWTDPATFAAALGADDNYVTDSEKALLPRLGALRLVDDVSFNSVTATGFGGLKAGIENDTQGAITLYSNVNPFAVGIYPAATPTGTWSLRLPPGAPGGANYLFNVDADGTGGWTDPATLGGDNLGSATAANVVSLFNAGTCSGYLKSDGTCDSPSGSGDMVLASAQTVTGAKTFEPSTLLVKGSSTGTTAITSANTGATNYTLTLPAADGNLARISDIPTSASGISFTPEGSISATNVQAAIEEVRDEAGGGSLPAGTLNQLLQHNGTSFVATSTLNGIGNITGAGSYNNITVTQPATGATLTLVEGSTLATSGANSLTLTTTAPTNVTLPTSGTLATTAQLQAKYVSGTEADFYGTLLDPQAIYAVDGTNHAVTIANNVPAAFTITEISVACDADPTTEITLTFQHKAAGIGYGTPTTIEAVTTVNGTITVTSGIDDATIPAGTKMFMTLSAPDDALNECAWQIKGAWD